MPPHTVGPRHLLWTSTARPRFDASRRQIVDACVAFLGIWHGVPFTWETSRCQSLCKSQVASRASPPRQGRKQNGWRLPALTGLLRSCLSFSLINLRFLIVEIRNGQTLHANADADEPSTGKRHFLDCFFARVLTASFGRVNRFGIPADEQRAVPTTRELRTGKQGPRPGRIGRGLSSQSRRARSRCRPNGFLKVP
jgi:hypothetical protein